MRFDVLSRKLNVFEPHFLEASAGTGKTFAIEHLVARLLIESNPAMSIDQILIVTFTRAACRELKLRIRKNLEKIKQELTSQAPTLDYCSAIVENKSSLQEAIDRVNAALICYDSAQIYTLHGFCHRMLKEFPFEAGVGLHMSDTEETQHHALLEQVARDYLKEDVRLPHYSPLQIHNVLKSYRYDPQKMVSALVQLASNSHKIAPILSYEEAYADFLQKVRLLQPVDSEKWIHDMQKLISQYKGMTDKAFADQIQLLAEILSKKMCTLEQFDQLLKGDFFLEKMQDDNKKKRSLQTSLHYPDLLDQLRQALLPSVRIAGDSNCTFLRLASDFKKKSEEVLEKEEKFSPDHLLHQVQHALKSPHFVTKVREKFRAAIIDEFQDTDPVQWNIFETLFVSHLNALCLVGDPKQSIYAFRNADIYVYLEAAKKMGASAKKYLDTNFRSIPPLVEGLNQLFSQAKGWMHMPSCEQALDVLPVQAGVPLCSHEEPPIQFWIVSGKKGRSHKFPTDQMLEGIVFPHLAKEIASLQNKISFNEIAILVKDRFQAHAVIDYLKAQGISAHTRRSISITQSRAYFALKEILMAVLCPNDMGKLKIALGSCLIKANTDLLARPTDDPVLLEAKACMHLLGKILRERGFAPFFQQLLRVQLSFMPDSILQNCIQNGDYLDLRRLCELLVEEELKGTDLLLYLEEMSKIAHFDESRFKASIPDEKESVQVMTVHMSKGLEFDTVFALGIASRHKNPKQIVLKENKKNLTALFDAENTACLHAIFENDAEKMRQLYVALTRAKSRLYIPVFLDEEQKEIALGEGSPTELFLQKMLSQDMNLLNVQSFLSSISPHITTHILETQKELKLEKVANAPPVLIPPVQFNFAPCVKKEHSFTSLAKKTVTLELLKPLDDAIPSPLNMPLGVETGCILHALFEGIFKKGLHNLHHLSALEEEIFSHIAFTSLEKWRAIFLPWIEFLLRKPLTTFALCEVPTSQLQQEMEFYYPAKQGSMKGFGDLFFQIENKYYLLDWKSNYLGPTESDYSPEKIAAVMQQNNYDLQASIYTKALKAYVKLFDNRPFTECFGGAIYYFVRAGAVFHFFPKEFDDSV